MTAARSTRRAIRGCRSASAAAGAARRGGGFRGPNGEPFEFSGGGEAADISDLFEGLFGRGGGRRGGGGPFGGFGRRSAPPQKGADVAYRLEVPFEDAARLTGQRVTLGSGKTLDIKLPPGVEDGTKIRLAGQGQPGPAGNGDAIVTIGIKPHRFFRREGDNIRLDLPVSIDEAALGGKVRVPTVDGPVMLSVPKGSSSGKVLRLKGKGFTGKNGQRGDQLVTLMVDVPDDAELARFLEGWSGRGKDEPPGGARRLAPRARDLPRIAGSKAQAARQRQGAFRDDPGEGPRARGPGR